MALTTLQKKLSDIQHCSALKEVFADNPKAPPMIEGVLGKLTIFNLKTKNLMEAIRPTGFLQQVDMDSSE